MGDLKQLLGELQRHKLELETDYRNKTHALKIDESCRTLTKVRAGGRTGGPPKAKVAAGDGDSLCPLSPSGQSIASDFPLFDPEDSMSPANASSSPKAMARL